jgi:hypothetical protein
MEYCNKYLYANQIAFSMLVPEDQGLFEFYRRQGYQESFGIQEVSHSPASIALQLVPQAAKESFPFVLTPAQPVAYNQRRNIHLQGRLHIAYNDEDITYQKRLSQASGADIYLIESDEAAGCVVAEFISPSKLLIKELLMDEKWIPRAMQEISGTLQARTYVFRIPPYANLPWVKTIRPLGMMKKHRKVDVKIDCEQRGYMGIAFD